MDSPKRLLRNTQKAVLAGVAAGFADYFDVDVVLVRAIFVVVAILTGFFPGVLAYLVLWLIIPKRETAVVPPPPVQASGP